MGDGDEDHEEDGECGDGEVASDPARVGLLLGRFLGEDGSCLVHIAGGGGVWVWVDIGWWWSGVGDLFIRRRGEMCRWRRDDRRSWMRDLAVGDLGSGHGVHLS